MTAVRDQLFPQKPTGSRFRFSRTGVQPSPGSSTIELPSAFAESGAYPPDRQLPGSPRQCSLPHACRHPPEGHQIGARKRRIPENTILSQPYCRRVSTDRPNRERPIKCQSRLWSQRGTKVNGSHHGDNPLLRPSGIQIAPKVRRLYKQRHRPISKRFIKPPYSISRATSIDSECGRLLTTSELSKKPEKYAPTSFDQQVQVSQGHTLYRNKKNEIPRSMVVEGLNW